MFAGATIAAVTWASARATLDMPDIVPAAPVLSDGLYKPQESDPLYLSGLLEPPMVGSAGDVAIIFDAQRPIRPVIGSGSTCVAAVHGLAAGPDLLTVVGVPFGPAAFRREDCLLAGVGAARTVCLLDARMVLSAAEKQKQTLDDCLGVLARQGQVAIFHPGPGADWLVARRDLRRLYPLLPLLCQPTKDDPTKVLRVAGWHLDRKERAGMVVVTSDVWLAGDAVKYKFVTHLVAPPEPAFAREGRLHVHESLAKLRDSLAARAAAE
jgi:hypothetical protein